MTDTSPTAEEQAILHHLEMLEALALTDKPTKHEQEESKPLTSSKPSPEKPSQRNPQVKQDSKREEFDELYDSDADSEDEQWVLENLVVGPESDGDGRLQLTCPNCFTLLCVQCKPVEENRAQFRARHVLNCVTKQSGNTRQVVCKICDAEVGLRDKDDSYVFRNVIC